MRHRFCTLLLVSLAGCAPQAEPGYFTPTNGLGSVWTAFVIGLTGVLLPDLVARWIEWGSRSIVRLASAALLTASSIALADTYFNLGLVN